MFRPPLMLCFLIMALVCINGCADSATDTTVVQPEYVYQIGDTVRHKSGQVAVVIDSRWERSTWDNHGYHALWVAQDKNPSLPWHKVSYITGGRKFHEWFAEYELERGPE